MLGSNFPVDKLYMSYQDLLIHWHDLLKDHTLVEKNFITNKTATDYYQLP
jgi:predicted TIM-barrel fold metal-dependent hydrolase